MSGGGGGGSGSKENGNDMEALLREFPALARMSDGRLKCSLTGHVMAAKVEVVHPYVKGKKFAAALAKQKDLEGLRQFEPHIVRSKYVPGKLFCRITGRYVQAKESAVVQHSTGKRFERGVQMLTSGQGGKLMSERHPEEVEAERKKFEEEQKAATSARKQNKTTEKAVAAAAAAKKAKHAAKGGGNSEVVAVEFDDEEDEEEIGKGTGPPVEDARAFAERERIRVNGGFSKEMGCWVPPAHVICSDEEDEEESDDDEEEESEEDAGVEGGSGDEYSDDDKDDVLMPTVMMPNFAKIMASVKNSGNKAGIVPSSSRRQRPTVERNFRRGITQPNEKKKHRRTTDTDAFDWNGAGVVGEHRGGTAQRWEGVRSERDETLNRVTSSQGVTAGNKRVAEAPLKNGKKVNKSKQVKRSRG